MDRHRGDLLLSEEDRLPWLEPAEHQKPDDPRAALRWILIGVGAVVVLAVLIAGGLWLTRGGEVTDGGGALIEAPDGPYKVRPTEPGGMQVEGQGDTSFAASNGVVVNGSIDLGAQAEAPVETQVAPPAPDPAAPRQGGGASASAAIPASGGRLEARPAGVVASAPAGGAAAGGTTVQLGSFNSESRAREAWTLLGKRFAFLGERQPQIATAEVAGRDVYRLRVDAASPAAARELCQRMRVGGEACLVVGR